MHANTAVLVLALSAATPALSAPLSLGTLGKEIGKGLVTGAGLAGVVDGVESLVGSGSSTSSKRELTADDVAALQKFKDSESIKIGFPISKRSLLSDIENALNNAGSIVGGIVKREPTPLDLTSILKNPLGVGPACFDIDPQTGTCATPIRVEARSLLSDIENALKNAGSVVEGIVKREPQLPPCSDFGAFGPGDGLGPACTLSSTSSVLARSLLSKILPAAEESVEDILKKAVAGGAAAGVGGAAVDAATGSSKRELTDEQLLALMFAGGNDGSVQKREPLSLGPIGKLILGTGASIATSSVVGDAIDAVTGQSSKREIDARNLLSDIENALKNAGSIVGGIVKREPQLPPCSLFKGLDIVGLGPACSETTTSTVSARSLLSKILPAAEEGVDDILKKAIAGGAAAGIGAAAVDAATGSSSSKRELTDEQLLALMFAGGNDGVEKREPLSLGPIGRLLTGAAASIATSSVVGDAINAVTGQSSKREPVFRGVGSATTGINDEKFHASINDLD